MASTYAPEVTFDLPSGSDEAQEVRRAVGLRDSESETWGKHSGECPDDLRSTIGHAVASAYDGCIDPWLLVPRRVEYDGARVRVKFAVESDVYPPGEEPDVADSPEQRVLETLREYHEELHANEVATQDLLDETAGEQATLRQALAELERRGEVYQPDPEHYRITGQ